MIQPHSDILEVWPTADNRASGTPKKSMVSIVFNSLDWFLVGKHGQMPTAATKTLPKTSETDNFMAFPGLPGTRLATPLARFVQQCPGQR
jgi:hypothetical protein